MIFVYGTLRAGESLADCLPETAPRTLARTRGRLHYAHGCRGIPVMLPPAGPDDWVHGELVDISLFHPLAESTTTMELEAGYNAEWSKVMDNDGGVHDAIVFVYRHGDYGDPIPGGDYTRRSEGPTHGKCEFDAYEDSWCHTHQTFQCDVSF